MILVVYCVHDYVRYSNKSPVTEDSQGLSFQIATLDHSGRLNIWVCVYFCLCVCVFVCVCVYVCM